MALRSVEDIAEVPCPEDLREDHDVAIACLLEAMDDESPLLTPLLTPVCDGYTDRSNNVLLVTRPQQLFRT